MKLHDRDGSVLALGYVYCAYPEQTQKSVHTLIVYSHAGEKQYFYYDNSETMNRELQFIEKWIEVQEMSRVPST